MRYKNSGHSTFPLPSRSTSAKASKISCRVALMPINWKATASSSASMEPLWSSSMASKQPRIRTTSSAASSTGFLGLSDFTLDFRSFLRKFRDCREIMRSEAQFWSTSSNISRPPCSATSSISLGSSRVSWFSAATPKQTMVPSWMASVMWEINSSTETMPKSRSAKRATSGRLAHTSATAPAAMPRPRRSISSLNSSPPTSAMQTNAPSNSLAISPWRVQARSISMVSATIAEHLSAQADCRLEMSSGFAHGAFSSISSRSISFAHAAASRRSACARPAASKALASSRKRPTSFAFSPMLLVKLFAQERSSLSCLSRPGLRSLLGCARLVHKKERRTRSRTTVANRLSACVRHCVERSALSFEESAAANR
mmetsp:Transcript_89603/g.233659  ORF Transcript_89603/g.233659 Transcript_89603/m.233659 type:complete len:371 (-) Transcript_89603:194-1306(-)